MRAAAAWLAASIALGCEQGAPAPKPLDSSRHRALRAVRAALATLPLRAEDRDVPPQERTASRAAIDAAWDKLLASPLGVALTAEHEEPPRSLVLHIQTPDPTILTQQVELMQALPPSVGLRLVLGGSEAERALEQLVAAGPQPSLLARAERLHVPPGQFSSVWARDFAVGDEGCQVVPLFLRPGAPDLRPGPSRPLNEVVDLLAARGTRVLRAPVYFAGGNVVVGRLRDGRRLMLCGSNDYLLSRDTYRDAGLWLSEDLYVALLRAVFDVADVLMLGPRGSEGNLLPQADALFHLDQAMMFHRDGEVLVHQVIPTHFLPEGRLSDQLQRTAAAAARDLDTYSAILARVGFTVSRMPISAERVVLRQYYLNSLQVPVSTGRPLAIVPSFAHTTSNAAEDDESARRFLEGRGFEVVMVRDMAHLGQGSNHCLVRRG